MPGLPAAKRKQSKSPKRNKSNLPDVRSETKPDREDSSASFRTLGAALFRHRRFVVCLVGGLSAACVLYCLIAPKEFEAGAKIALRSSPATALSVDGANGANSTAFASDQTQLETLADVFRSDQTGVGSHWRPTALLGSRICGRFEKRFHAATLGPDAQAYLLERFRKRLNVRTLPRTLIVQIRFRSRDPALSAAVVNGLIRVYNQEETASRQKATEEATASLATQLNALKSRVSAEDRRLG